MISDDGFDMFSKFLNAFCLKHRPGEALTRLDSAATLGLQGEKDQSVTLQGIDAFVVRVFQTLSDCLYREVKNYVCLNCSMSVVQV